MNPGGIFKSQDGADSWGLLVWIDKDRNILDVPKQFSLFQNYPNPFNPSTNIEFDLPKTGDVTLKIFNILGEEVTTLVSDRLNAGSYSYEWDASNLASGLYLYRLSTGSLTTKSGHYVAAEAGNFVETRKMVLMR
jgi:hypothetical protein